MNTTLSLNANDTTTYLADYTIPNYLVDEIHLEFHLAEGGTIVKSHLRIRNNRLAAKKMRELILNGEELQLESIALNKQPLTPEQYTLTDKLLIIHQAPDNFTLDIVVKIFPEKNMALTGLYRSQKTYCTQCEAEGFRRITYFPDRPDVLTRYVTTIIADAKQYPYLLSNGNLIATGQLDGNMHWAKWEDPFKKPCYLFALVAGDFDILQDKFITQAKREASLRAYVEKGYGNQAYHALYSLKKAMAWDEKTYGREYDLDIFMLVAISDFNMGAMENKGLNIFNTKYILAEPQTATDNDYINILSVIAHEYFHNWSGNRVTCRDWFQLSLKEGLTIFRDQTFSEDVLSKAVMRIRDVADLRESQFIEDAGPLAHPVRPDSYIEINNFYTATVYNKGAEVLRMLRTILGVELFCKGMDLYFARFDGQAVTIDDFVGIMQDVSGINLTQFKLWYTQAGTPNILVEDDYDENNHRYTLTFTQNCPSTPNQPHKEAMFIPIRMGLLNAKGEALPLQLEHETSEPEKIVMLSKTSQIVHFKNIASRPIPSLLRNFSAPVKIQYPYTDHELLFLFKHDNDEFNRWEAGQKYLLKVIFNLLRQYRQQSGLILPEELISAFEFVLLNTEDKLLAAEMLILPSETYIGEQMEIVDIEGIHYVREFALKEIAQQLQITFKKIYLENHQTKVFQFDIKDIGQRQLKNLCLNYLMRLSDHVELGVEQFKTSLKINMTDTQAALTGITNIDSPARIKALNEFHGYWQQDALVIDKWLALQALSSLPNTLSEVKKLRNSSAFDLKNPNKVYALIGTYTHRNLANFHSIDGESYAFLREIVQQLDRLNPQLAARMVNPLTTWKRYDKERQKLMREQLELLRQNTIISPDLFELVTKSLDY